MKRFGKILLWAVPFGMLAFAVYSIGKRLWNGVRDIKSLALAPFVDAGKVLGLAKNAAGAVVDTVAPAASLPFITTTETNLLQDSQNTIESDYAPGGRVYNQVLQTQGQAAADAMWQSVQADYAINQKQAASDSSLFGFGNLFSF